MEIVLATHNKNKVKEFIRILEPMEIILKMPDLTEVDETGKTFRENAFIKAKSACDETGLPAIADDSGMCVDFLGGEPGVYSARYAAPGKGKITVLQKMEKAKDNQRSAQFVSAICCVFPNGDIIEAEGICNGEIAKEIMGDGGFSYDPIFKVGDKTFAQMTLQEKDAVSHRGIALREFEKKLNEYLRR